MVPSKKKRLKRMMVLVCAVVTLSGLGIGAYLVTRESGEFDVRNRAAESYDSITFMTYNIAVSYPSHNPDYNVYINMLADYIIENQLDIVALQEVPRNRDDQNLHPLLISKLAEKGYSMEGVHDGRATRVHGIQMGQSILSRYPISDHEIFLFDSWYDDGKSKNPVQTVKITLPSGKSFRVINHHPHPRMACHDDYFPLFMNVVNGYADEDRLLMGDFNFTRRASCFQDLTSAFIDSCNPAVDKSCEDTVNTEQYDAVDFIFFQKQSGWDVVEAYSDHNMQLSDHFPVIAKFQNTGYVTVNGTVHFSEAYESDILRINNCNGTIAASRITDQEYEFSFQLEKGSGFCLRIEDSSGLGDITINHPSKSGFSSYEWQVAGIDCGESGTNCNENQQLWDMSSATDFEFYIDNCSPNCSGKDCGDDGCGGSCGTCPSGLICNSSGMCVSSSPDPAERDVDLNGDGEVNMNDYGVFVNDYLVCRGGVSCDSESDFDDNGDINMLDYTEFVEGYFEY